MCGSICDRMYDRMCDSMYGCMVGLTYYLVIADVLQHFRLVPRETQELFTVSKRIPSGDATHNRIDCP